MISKKIRLRLIFIVILLALGLRCILPFTTTLAILALGVVITGLLFIRQTKWVLITLSLAGICTVYADQKILTIEQYQRLASASAQALSGEQLQATIVSPPTVSSDRTSMEVALIHPRLPANFKAKVYLRGSHPSLRPNDTISFQGDAYIPTNKDDATFDYVRFLAKDGIFLEIRAQTLHSHDHSSLQNIQDILYQGRNTVERAIERMWPGDTGGLISGILIGSKTSLSDRISEAFRITGLSHIVAISGFNITIIIVFVFHLLSWAPKKIQIFLAGIFIVIFVLFVGPSAAVVRAGIMGCIGLVAMYSERKSTVLTSLLLSAVVMCLANPLTLLYDIGFQLSFLAVLGLIYGDLFFGFMNKLPALFGLREALAGTLSAQLTTLPITLYYFGAFSIISPIANLFVTPGIPLGMLGSFISIVLSFVPFLEWLAVPFILATGWLVQALIFFTHFFSTLPYASVTVELFHSPVVLLLSYSILTGLILILQKRRDLRTEVPSSSSISEP